MPSPGQLAPRVQGTEELAQRPPIITFPSSDSPIPQDADRTEITVSQFSIEEGDPALAKQSAEILDEIRGRPVAVTMVYSAASRIESAYVDQGYFLTRVVIPPQDVLNGGELRLRVIQGYIESVDPSGVPLEFRDMVADIVGDLVNKRPLKRVEFERRVMLASDLPSIELRTNLVHGFSPGGLILQLAGSYQPVTGQVSVDNSLPNTLGRYSTSVYGAYNLGAGTGQQVYANISASTNMPPFTSGTPRKLAVLGWRAPIGNDGLGLTLDGTASETKPIVSTGEIETRSIYERATAKLDYPLIKTRSDTLLTRGSIEAVHEEQTATQFKTTLYDDQMRIARAGLEWSHVFNPRTDLTASFDYSRGMHLLGAKSPSAGNPVSSMGASDVFSKVESRLRLHRELPKQFAADLQVHGQYAKNRPLTLSEKFTIGGTADLSSLDTASLTGDRGVASRAELQYTIPPPVKGWRPGAQLYVFGSRGEVVTLIPSAVENPLATINSAGGGVRASLRPSSARGPIDFGAECARTSNAATSGIADHWRANVFVNIQF